MKPQATAPPKTDAQHQAPSIGAQAPTSKPTPASTPLDKKRQQRRNAQLGQQLTGVERQLEGLKTLIFYIRMESDVPEGGEPEAEADVAEISGALYAATASAQRLRASLRPRHDNHRDPPPHGIVPAIEGSPAVTVKELEEEK